MVPKIIPPDPRTFLLSSRQRLELRKFLLDLIYKITFPSDAYLRKRDLLARSKLIDALLA